MDLYPSAVFESSGSNDSNIDDICQIIRDATKGFGTDEKALVHAIGSQTPEVRCLVAARYKELFEKDLMEVIEAECGKKPFGLALKYLSVPPDVAECHMIHDACKGLGTNEVLLTTIVSARSNKEMEHLKKKYFEIFTKDMGLVISSEIKRNFEFLLLNCLQASEEEYDESVHTAEKMKEDIQHLYKIGQAKLGCDEKGIFKFLCAAPPEYLKQLNLAYADEHGVTLLHSLHTELTGYAQDAAEFLVGMKIKPYEEVAKLIAKASKGIGTNETLLSATLIRYQMILKDVLLAHIELYGKSLADRVREETGRDYEAVLLEILAAVDAA